MTFATLEPSPQKSSSFPNFSKGRGFARELYGYNFSMRPNEDETEKTDLPAEEERDILQRPDVPDEVKAETLEDLDRRRESEIEDESKN